MSAKCIKCGIISTNQPDGICVLCRIDSDARVELLKEAKTDGGERMKEFKGGHKKCSKESCDKQAWRDGVCYRHWHIEHPEAKKHSRRTRKEQSRTEQSRAEQSRAEQSRAEQSRAEQSRAEQSRAEQSLLLRRAV